MRLATREINTRNTNRKPNINTGVVGVHLDRTNGLKKNYTTKLGGKTYRFYSLAEAVKNEKNIIQFNKEELYNERFKFLSKSK